MNDFCPRCNSQLTKMQDVTNTRGGVVTFECVDCARSILDYAKEHKTDPKIIRRILMDKTHLSIIETPTLYFGGTNRQTKNRIENIYSELGINPIGKWFKTN